MIISDFGKWKAYLEDSLISSNDIEIDKDKILKEDIVIL